MRLARCGRPLRAEPVEPLQHSPQELADCTCSLASRFAESRLAALLPAQPQDLGHTDWSRPSTRHP
jgi:hypothetical protein